MRQIVVPFVAALVGGGVGAFAATSWIRGERAGAIGPGTEPLAANDDLREQVRELKALLERPRELAALPTPHGALGTGAGPASGTGGSATDAARLAASPALAAAIKEAVAAGIAEARNKDAMAFAPPAPEPKKNATLAEVARDLNLSSAQEDDIRRAYAESTEKFLKLMAEPDSTPDAIRRELEEAKGDAGKRAGLVAKYAPKIFGKLVEVIAVQTEREQRIHKALGTENVPKFKKYKVAEEDPFGLDGANIDISTSVNDK